MANPTILCASLFVGNLHEDVNEASLYDRFQTFGNILSIRVSRDPVTRKSLGYAYVNFQTSTEAKNAMKYLSFEDIHGRPCRIMWSQRDIDIRRSGDGNIFIKNLDPSITVKEINDTFALFGEITSCKVQYDEHGASKVFAFVNFMVEEDAEKAIQAINGKMIRDKIVYVAKVVPRNQQAAYIKDFTNCYVTNIPTNIGENYLKDMFSEYGDIVSAKVMLDEEGVSKGFGFVRFLEHEQAVNAVNSLNGRIVGDKAICVGRAMWKNERVQDMNTRQEILQQQLLQLRQIDLNITSHMSYADNMEDKQLLGERIYPLVNKHAGDMAGKITGMFLELDNAELRYMIANEESLRMKIEEAITVLSGHKTEPGSHRP